MTRPHRQTPFQRGLTPAQRASLYELSRRTNRRALIVVPPLCVLFVLLIGAAGPAVGGGLAGLGGLLGIGIGLLLVRPLIKLRGELGLTPAQARVIVVEERDRRRSEEAPDAEPGPESAPAAGRRRLVITAVAVVVVVVAGVAIWRLTVDDPATKASRSPAGPATPTPVATLAADTISIMGLAYSPDGKTIAAGDLDKTVRIWDPAGRRNTATLTGSAAVSDVAFSPDGKLLATGGKDGVVRLWDVVAGTTVATLTGHTDQVINVVFTPDGKTLTTTSYDKTMRDWDVATGQPKKTEQVYVQSLAYSPDGRYLATEGTSVYVQDLVTRKLVDLYAAGSTDVMAFSPDGKTLVTGGYGNLRLWNPATGEETGTLDGHGEHVTCLAFSRDGRRLATGSREMTARVWDMATRTNRSVLNGHPDIVNNVAFSPDGKTLATASYHEIRLWAL